MSNINIAICMGNYIFQNFRVDPEAEGERRAKKVDLAPGYKF